MTERDGLFRRMQAIAQRGLKINQAEDIDGGSHAFTTFAVPSTLVRASSLQLSGSL